MSDSETLRPDFNSMILSPMLGPLIAALPVVLIVSLMSFFLGSLVLAVLLMVGVFKLAWALYKYRRTKYLIGPEKIRLKSATPVSASDKELLWSKVVQVRLDCGPVQKHLFGSGDLVLEAAGQAESEIRLKHLGDPEGVLDKLLEQLPEETTLPGDELVDTYQQSRLGIWLDFLIPTVSVGLAVGVVSALVVTFGNYRFPVFKYLVPAGLLIFFLTFLYFALKKIYTSYSIFQHHVVSETNFFGLKRRVVPLSVLSDVNVSLPLHKRLVGLGHLSLSVPGLGEEVVLKNLREVEALRQRLQDRSDRIKQSGESREVSPVKEDTGKRFVASPTLLPYLFPTLMVLVFSALVGAGISYSLVVFFQAPFFLNLGVALVPPLVVLPFFLYRLIIGLASSFAVEGNRVELTFSFLNKSVTSLSTDKIKGVVRSRGIVDRIFNTYSVTFHSIGSEKNVKFFCLGETTENREMIRQIRKFEGSAGGEKKQHLVPELTTPGVIFQHPLGLFLPLLIFFVPALIMGLAPQGPGPVPAITVGILLTALVSGGYLWYLDFYYSSCVSMTLYDDYLVYDEGYFYTRSYYVVYKDIRNVEYAREPLGTGGWLLVDFSGQTAAASNSSGSGSTNKGFTFRHLPEVESTARAVEEVFAGEIDPEILQRRREELGDRTETSLLTAKPLTLPYIFMGAGYGLLVFLLAGDVLSKIGVLVPALIAIIAGGLLGGIYRFTIFYVIKENQIEASHWMGFTRTKSIKYKNVDNLEIDRNLFDKILGTGTLLVSTTGGSGVELKARFIRNYRKFYEKLQDEYSEASTGETI